MTHNIDLLEQTHNSFKKFFAPSEMAVVSSVHSSFQNITKDIKKLKNLEILFASYLSCSTIKRKKVNVRHTKKDVSLENLKLLLKGKKAKKVFIVVDEAHRISAPTYQRVIKGLNANFKTKLLGLTATPYRTTELGQAKFDKTFSNGIISDAPTMNYLIKKRFLAIPTPVTIKTNQKQKDLLQNPDEYTEFQNQPSWKDLSARQLKSIGKNSARNKVIVDTYLNGVKGIKDFGKTIVFATDIIHCKTLEKEFSNAGIKALSVFSKKGIASKDENKENQSLFINEESGIDVIINVNMLTEGIDMPNVKTVFLARPTNSKSLFRQMIGRALRGPESGGTEKANLVTFVDSWNKYQPIEGGDIVPELQKESESTAEYEKQEQRDWNLKLIMDVYDKVKFVEKLGTNQFEAEYIVKWQPLEESGDDLELIVFQNWSSKLFELINEAKEEGKFEKCTLEYLKNKFSKSIQPAPNKKHELSKIQSLLEFVDEGGEPTLIKINDFLSVSPQNLANELFEKTIDQEIENEEDIDDVIEDQASSYWKKNRSILKNIHEDRFEFTKSVKQFWNKNNQKNPVDEIIINQLGLTEFTSQKEGFDLNEIAKKVSEIYRKKYNEPLIPDENWKNLSIRFSQSSEFRSTFAYHLEDELSEKREIVFSRQLNSPEVPRFVIEAVMFHELVHNRIGNDKMHGKEFREIEERYKPSDEALSECREKFEEYYNFFTSQSRKPIEAEKKFLRGLSIKRKQQFS